MKMAKNAGCMKIERDEMKMTGAKSSVIEEGFK
jgi:hypothetical protein